MRDIAETAQEKNEQYIKRNNKWNLIIIGVVLIVFLIVTITGKGKKGQGMSFSETGMTIIDSEGKETQVPYESMKEVKLFTNADYGTEVSGTTTGFLGAKQMEGVWRSDMFGEYTACCSSKISSAILIRTDTASYVINMENDKSTAALYDALLQQLAD